MTKCVLGDSYRDLSPQEREKESIRQKYQRESDQIRAERENERAARDQEEAARKQAEIKCYTQQDAGIITGGHVIGGMVTGGIVIPGNTWRICKDSAGGRALIPLRVAWTLGVRNRSQMTQSLFCKGCEPG